MALKKIRLHWSVHPEKDQAWYEEQKSRMTVDEVARELDINYALSASGTVFKNEFKEHLHVFYTPYEVNPNRKVIRVTDYGRVNASLFLQQDGYGALTAFKEIVLVDSNTKDQALAVKAFSDSLKCTGFDDYGDPAGGSKRGHWDNDSATSTDDEIMRAYGIRPYYGRSQAMANRNVRGRQLIKLKLSERYNGRECIQIYGPGCPTLVEAFQFGYRYKTDKNGEIVHNDAVHEEHPWEDIMDCFRYACIELFDVTPRSEKPRKAIRPYARNKYTGH